MEEQVQLVDAVNFNANEMKKTNIYFILIFVLVFSFASTGYYAFLRNTNFAFADDDEEDENEEEDEEDEEDEGEDDSDYTETVDQQDLIIINQPIIPVVENVAQSILKNENEVVYLSDRDRDGIADKDDLNPDITEIYIVKDDNLNGIADNLENEK